MAEEINNQGHGGHGVEFEREDLSTRGIFAFMIGLAVTGLIIHFILTGMYSFLDKYEKSQMTSASPLVSTTGADTRAVTPEDLEKIRSNGAPMLETDERGQFYGFLMNQEKELNSYGWVDEKAGVVHIPIERAMQVVAQRGLPVIPATGAAENGSVSAAKGVGNPPK